MKYIYYVILFICPLPIFAQAVLFAPYNPNQSQQQQHTIIYPAENKRASYCDGWENGYKNGWCYKLDGCFPPVVPVCPVPIGTGDYTEGYDAGFLQALNDRKR